MIKEKKESKVCWLSCNAVLLLCYILGVFVCLHATCMIMVLSLLLIYHPFLKNKSHHYILSLFLLFTAHIQ
jgi:hypothetical protein